MPKHPSRKTLVRNLDKAVSEYIRNRDEYCVVCGSPKNLTNGHLFSRIAYSTRWDVSADGNNHCQCLSCNFKHEFDPYPFSEWYRQKFGEEKYHELHRRYKTVRKFKNYELEELLDEIKSHLSR